MAAESASDSKMLQTARKIKENGVSRRLGQGWIRCNFLRPGGRRVGSILRFAEADTDLISEVVSASVLNTAVARKGLAVFNRSAHSAGPGNGP